MAKTGQARAKAKTGKAKDEAKTGKAGTTAGSPAVLPAVPCALCRRPVHHEPGPGKAAKALTRHYNDEHLGDERLKDLADGTREVQHAVWPAYL
jgi:hypothetical protein